MSTVIRPELSIKNRYYISRHRYYELKHFCLQYPEWSKQYALIDGYARNRYGERVDISSIEDTTSIQAQRRAYYSERMKLIERTAMEADSEIGSFIFRAVTQGLSFTTLKMMHGIPCEKDMYYDRYRKFFWLLDKSRD